MFDDYFDIYLADTPQGKEEHFKLRFKVYCEEMGFEDRNAFSPKREHDRWDENSVHFLVRHKETEQWVGAMRMVFEKNGTLPFKELCTISPEDNHDSVNIEISRLCLIKNIRKRETDKESPLGLNVKSDKARKEKNISDLYSRRQINKSLIWGLFRAASLYSAEHNIDKWYFLCTKALARIISKEGFRMSQVGKGCYHRGERFPFGIDVKEILANAIWSKDYQKGFRLYSELQVENEVLLENVA